jgi:hypothetical protein
MTINISAPQHFYASIRQDQSPVGRRGLQTLFYTQSLLSKSEVREIEDRAQFDATGEVKSKWQFYCLSTRKVVISYLSLVPEPDEFGRTGRYFAHSLVLGDNDWRQLGSSPFPLLSDTVFCNSLEEVLKQGDMINGDCPAHQMEAEPDWNVWAEGNAREWGAESLRNLAAAAIKARLILEEDSFVSLVGDERQIIDALGVAFLHTPAEKRHRCSFDTASLNCVWPAHIQFWGRGFSQRDEASAGIMVDTVSRTIELPAKYALQKFDGARPESSRARPSSTEPARREPQPENATAAASPQSLEFVDERIRELMPPFISPELAEFMLSKAGDTPSKRQRWLHRHPHAEAVYEELFLTLARDWKSWPPSLEDQQALFAVRHKHNGIELLLALWSKDPAASQDCLERMSCEQYLRCLILLNHERELPPWRLFSLKHLGDWFRYSRRPFLLEDLVRGLEEARALADDDLPGLAEVIDQLDQKQQKSLLHWLRSSGSPRFSNLLSAFDLAPEKKEGLLSRLLNR